MDVSSSGGKANPLARQLATLRQDRGLSLRRVEEITDKAVSNGYLSQIESGKVAQPSPHVLRALAGAYHAKYDHLMRLAGYTAARKSMGSAQSRVEAIAALNPTDAEAQTLVQYLRFIRSNDTTKK